MVQRLLANRLVKLLAGRLEVWLGIPLRLGSLLLLRFVGLFEFLCSCDCQFEYHQQHLADCYGTIGYRQLRCPTYCHGRRQLRRRRGCVGRCTHVVSRRSRVMGRWRDENTKTESPISFARRAVCNRNMAAAPQDMDGSLYCPHLSFLL